MTVQEMRREYFEDCTSEKAQLMIEFIRTIQSFPEEKRAEVIDKTIKAMTEIRSIEEITSAQANALIEAWCNHIEIPKAKWYCKEGKKWIGIFNETDDCWVEEFDTKAEVLEWLIF